MGDAMWLHAVFSKSRDWLLTSDVAQQFFAEVKLRGPEKLDGSSSSVARRTTG
jgi:hypothetical protein